MNKPKKVCNMNTGTIYLVNTTVHEYYKMINVALMKVVMWSEDGEMAS